MGKKKKKNECELSEHKFAFFNFFLYKPEGWEVEWLFGWLDAGKVVMLVAVLCEDGEYSVSCMTSF